MKESGDLDIVDTEILLNESRAAHARVKDSIRAKRSKLGVSQRVALQKLKDDAFLQLRMNARAVKTRLRDRLRQRKFELDGFERSYRHSMNGTACQCVCPCAHIQVRPKT